jgi:hypothetical protein
MGAKASVAANEAAQGAGIIQSLLYLVGCEADEPEQVAMLNDAIDAVQRWVIAERSEVGTAEDLADTQLAYPSMKAWHQEMKAEPLDVPQLDRWLSGKVPRRVLMVPFGGPLPGGKAGLGVDLDGEYFDADTDLFGPFPTLRASRDRLVDWHHDLDPTGAMKGALLGRVVMDEKPEADGLWADFWADAGEKRRNLIAALERRGVPLFGSSQAIPTAVRGGKGRSTATPDGHVEVWPVIRHTITTSPQNTLAVVPALKALLTIGIPTDAISTAAIKAAMLGMDDGPSRSTAPTGSAPIDAGLAPEVLAKAEQVVDALAAYVRSLT